MTTSEFTRNIIAGGGAGAFETAIFFPLDTVKTRQQLAHGADVGTLATLRGIVRTDGWRGLYRGIAAPMVSEVPRRAIKFSANGFYQRTLAPHRAERPAVWLATTCGALTGATETLLHTPFETVKTQLQSPGATRRVGARSTSRAGRARRACTAVSRLTRSASGVERRFRADAVASASRASGGGGGGGSMLVNFSSGSGRRSPRLNNPLDVAKSRLQARPGHSQVPARGCSRLVARIARAGGSRWRAACRRACTGRAGTRRPLHKGASDRTPSAQWDQMSRFQPKRRTVIPLGSTRGT